MPFALFPDIHYDEREPPPPDHDLGQGNEYYQFLDPNRQELDAQRHWYPCAHVGAFRQQHGDVQGPVEVENHDQDPHRKGILSPLSTSVKVQIIHDTARFNVIQLFRNESCNIKQGMYQFPLPLDATVTSFDCRIGPNKIIHGKVKASEDSQYEFNEARRQGRAGGLMEQQTAEIFTITFANIPARTKMQAELSFMCFLKHQVAVDHQIFTLTVPTFIAPRYGDAPPGVGMVTRDSHLLSLSVEVLSAEELISVKSETHAIRCNRGMGPAPCQTWDDFVTNRDNDAGTSRAASVELGDRLTSLDKDLVITIDTALSDHAEAPLACLETHPTLRNHKALMLTLPPELMTAAANGVCDSDIIFLADRSGSMADKIEGLKSVMMYFIGGIPRNRHFNIWCFGTGYTSLWPQSRRLNEVSRQEAMAYVHNEFAANMGGTEILSALQEICKASGGQRSMDVIVLTDGEVWSAPQTIDFVRSRWLISEGWIRFFSLGIGAAVSHELIEGIATAGGGYADVITSASCGGWEDRVVAVLNAATTGHIGSLGMKLEWQEEGNLKSTLKVREPNGNTITKTILPKRLHQSDTFIHKLAARALLGGLERGESWLHRGRHAYGGIAPSDSMIKAEAIELGCRWSLVSRWTSVYAVEEVMEPNAGTEMEGHIVVAADDLDDALLTHRGGQAAANLASGLLRSRAEAEESGTESDDSETSVSTCSNGQPEDSDNSDGDGDDNDDDPGFNPNTGLSTNRNSVRSSQGHRQEEQPKESEAPSDIPQCGTLGYQSSSISSSPENDPPTVNYSAQLHFYNASMISDTSVMQSTFHMPSPLFPLVEPCRDPTLLQNIEDFSSSLASSGLWGNSGLSRDVGTETRFENGPITDISPFIPLMAQPSPNYAQFVEHSLNSEGPLASAPIFNPPASTSLLQNVNQAAKSPDKVAAEQFIGRLLVQTYDGRFSFPDNEGVKAALGLPFLAIVTRLRGKLNLFDPTVAIAIIALLEEQFSGCWDLWVLMVRKAKDYITRCNLGPIVEELQQAARQGVKLMGSVIKELKDGEAALESVTELKTAPPLKQRLILWESAPQFDQPDFKN
ncbi:von Willebrand factor type A domain-containing protein [Fusarium mundagurra]|uniref:von Willebrand factor type A domain-containing protein n=1 Tax=Fusarium mundagurra TaxID=1567541 RepID=A0A8H5XUX9_9HYPO|nr:von Willebrand factor type A domain-containing protein [Fusarium mundagurra]